MLTVTDINTNVRARMEAIAKAMIQSQIPPAAFDTDYLSTGEREAFHAAWRKHAGS